MTLMSCHSNGVNDWLLPWRSGRKIRWSYSVSDNRHHLCQPVTGEFPSQRPVTRSFDVFFDMPLNKRLSKQSRRRWFETLLSPLWRNRNALDSCVNRNMFLSVSLTISHYRFRWWLGAEQAISHCLNQWWLSLLMHIYAPPGLNELTNWRLNKSWLVANIIVCICLKMYIDFTVIQVYSNRYNRQWNRHQVISRTTNDPVHWRL